MASARGQNGGKRPVIILLRARLTKDHLRIFFEKNFDRYGEYSITLVTDDDLEQPTFTCMFDYVSSLIKTFERLPLVVAMDDRVAVVHAALAKVFPHIIAPSVESEFICIHKGESYKNSPEKYILPYLEVEPGSKVYPGELSNAKLGQFPLFVKPSLGTHSELIKKVQNLEGLNDFTKCNEQGVKRLDGGLHDFLSRFLEDTAKKNNLSCNSWIVQPYVDSKTNRLVCVDGLVTGGKIIIWNLFESVFWESHPNVIKSLANPIEISAAAREGILEAYHFVVEGLIRKGFNNQFVDMEAFVSHDGKVRITELNGRAIGAMYRSYVTLCGPKGDNIFALLQMASGITPDIPASKPGISTSVGYICINGKGKATDFIDFEAARNIEEIELKVDEDTAISHSSEWGHHVAWCYTSGKSLDEALDKCRNIADKIITAKDKCLWLA